MSQEPLYDDSDPAPAPAGTFRVPAPPAPRSGFNSQIANRKSQIPAPAAAGTPPDYAPASGSDNAGHRLAQIESRQRAILDRLDALEGPQQRVFMATPGADGTFAEASMNATNVVSLGNGRAVSDTSTAGLLIQRPTNVTFLMAFENGTSTTYVDMSVGQTVVVRGSQVQSKDLATGDYYCDFAPRPTLAPGWSPTVDGDAIAKLNFSGSGTNKTAYFVNLNEAQDTQNGGIGGHALGGNDTNNTFSGSGVVVGFYADPDRGNASFPVIAGVCSGGNQGFDMEVL